MLPRPRTVKLVAELGINHNGEIENVITMMNMAKLAGFEYVKFQKRDLDLVIPLEDRDKLRDTPWGTIRYMEYKQHLELNHNDFCDIADWCDDNDMQWFASPWDVNSLDFLNDFGMPYVKVASACVTNTPLLQAIAVCGIPVIMSTGGSTRDQVNEAAAILGDHLQYVLACTASYPSVPDEQNLKFISRLACDYPDCKVGFSNHNPGVLFAAASVCFGARMIETHITIDRAMYGSDQAASVELEGMMKLNKYVRSLEQGIGDGFWTVYDSELDAINKLRKVVK